MKTTLAILVTLAASAASAKTQGDLLCWKASAPRTSVRAYNHGGGLEPISKKTDSEGRHSFIVEVGRDFDESWAWQENSRTVGMGWSITECEDMEGIGFPAKALKQVL